MIGRAGSRGGGLPLSLPLGEGATRNRATWHIARKVLN